MMSEVESQHEEAPPIAKASKPRIVKKRATGLPRRGKKPYPRERLRVLISVRILPATRDALLKLGSDNLGRAIDELVNRSSELLAAEALSVPVTRI